MQRRAFIGVALASVTRAYSAQADVAEVLERLVSALSEANVPLFLGTFAKDFADRETLRAYISGLVGSYEVTSSVRYLGDSGDAGRVDWYMEFRSRQTGTVVARRQQEVTIEVRSKKISKLSPIDLFKPPAV